MLKRIKLLLTHNALYIAIILTIIIAMLSLIKIGKQTIINFSYLDKIEHATAYFVLTFFWLLAFKNSKKAKFLVVGLCIFYGMIIEVLQVTLTNYRYAEYLDALANTFGALIALLVFNIFFEKKQSI